MKIQLTLPVHQVDGIRAVGAGAQPPAKKTPSDQVRLSDTARFIQGLRDSADSTPDVREDAVATARADLAAGRLGGEQDVEAALDGLLAGL